MNDKFENDNNFQDEFHFSEKSVVNSSEKSEWEEFPSETLENESFNQIKPPDSVRMPKKLRNFLVFAIVILSCLILVLAGYIVYSLKDISWLNNSSTSSSANSTPSEVVKVEEIPTNQNGYTAESIYESMAPSVVGVVVYDAKASIVSDPLSEGSGIIISEDGYIVTNSHVVGDSKEYGIKVVLNSGEEFSGKVVGFDTKTDIAVIKADKTGLKPATFGNSDEVKVGSSVLALGNPLGLNFASSLTKGIVSAVNRYNSAQGVTANFVKYIQTDTAINPGNSGGPLINMYGQVIGITSSKIVVAHCEGMGFAIPSNTAKSVVNDIISKGYVTGRVRLGLSGKMVSNYQSQMYNVPIGIIVSEISKESNLAGVGVQVGDIITKINNVAVISLDSFYAELYKHHAGDSVTLSVYRPSINRFNGANSSKSFDVNVVLLEDKGEN